MELRERIQHREALFGYALTYNSPGILENVGANWDWIWIDAQHGELTMNGLAGLLRAADLVGTPAIVRVPDLSTASISLALDCGATGVMVPMVETRAHAEEAVRAARFPPAGGRSYAGRRVNDLHASPGYLEVAEKRTVVILQIETATAVENVGDIASVPGVDVLFVGPTDLRLSMGLDMSSPLSEPRVEAAVEAVVDAASDNDIAAGTVAVDRKDIQWYLDKGLRFMAVGVDAASLSRDAQERRGWIKEWRS